MMDDSNIDNEPAKPAGFVVSSDDVATAPPEYIDTIEGEARSLEIESDALNTSMIDSFQAELDECIRSVETDVDVIIARIEGDADLIESDSGRIVGAILNRLDASAERLDAESIHALVDIGASGPVTQDDHDRAASLTPVQSAIDYYYVPTGQIPITEHSLYAEPEIDLVKNAAAVNDAAPMPIAPAALETFTATGFDCSPTWSPVQYYTGEADMIARGYSVVSSTGAEIEKMYTSGQIPYGTAIPDPYSDSQFWLPPCIKSTSTAPATAPAPGCEPPTDLYRLVKWDGTTCAEGGPVAPPVAPAVAPAVAPPVAPKPMEFDVITIDTGTPTPTLSINWGSTEVCANLGKVGTGFEADRAGIADGLKSLIGPIINYMFETIPTGEDVVGKAIENAARTATTLITAPVSALLGVVDGIGRTFTLNTARNPEIAAGSAATTILSGFIARWAGGPWDYLTQSSTYALQWASPQFLPTQSEIDQQWITGIIDDEQWVCLTRAQGNIPERRAEMVAQSVNRPGVREQIELEMRGLQAPTVTDQELIRQGVKSATDRAKFRAVMQQTPQAADIIRFMVRDAFNEETVRANEYDNGFNDNFLNSEVAKRLAKAIGVSDEQMKLLWRSHWDIPSYTQLTEMLHRLRPGKALGGVNPVTLTDVTKALQVNDMAPAWVDRLTAISYATITRTDLQQWYIDGTIQKPELIERLQDNGYSLADSNRIADSWDTTIELRRKTRSNTLTINQIVKMYVDGTMSRFVASGLMNPMIPDPAQIQQILDEADAIRLSRMTGKCISGIRRRFFNGEFTKAAAEQQLRALNVDQIQIDHLTGGWLCERESKGRLLPLGKLQRLLERGLLTVLQIRQRMENLGWKPVEIDLIVQEWLATSRERRERIEKQAIKERIALAEKNARLSRQARKDFQSEIDRLKKIAKEQSDSAKEAQKALDKAIADAEKQRGLQPSKVSAAKATAAKATAAKARKLTDFEKAELKAQKAREKADREAAAAAADQSSVADVDDTDNSPLSTDNDDSQPEEFTGDEDVSESNLIDVDVDDNP